MNNIAIKNGDTEISYSQLEREVNNFITHLRLYNVESIALYMANSPAWIVTDQAASKIKILTVPIPLFFSKEQLIHLFNDSSVNYIISDKKLDSNFIVAINKITTINIFSQTVYLYQCSNANKTAINCDKLTYTSGTTSNPKGVMLESKEMLKVVDSIINACELKDTDNHLALLPFSLLLENIIGINAILKVRATVVIPTNQQLGMTGSSKYNMQNILNCIDEEKITTMITVPAIASELTRIATDNNWVSSSLRFVAVGGAPVSNEIINLAHKAKIPLFQGYGLSECCSVVSLNTAKNNKIDSVGKLLNHSSVKISDDGEVMVKGSVAVGYLNGEKFTEEYYKTGDLGYIKDGFLFITGRKKLSFCTAFGRNISPEWIEKEIVSNLDIKFSLLFGEARDYNIAILVTDLTRDKVKIHIENINRKLPDYAQVSDFFIISNLDSKYIKTSGTLDRDTLISDYKQEINNLYNETKQ